MAGIAWDIQRTLESIYRIEGPARVHEFTVCQRRFGVLFGTEEADRRREALLVQSDGEHVDVGLFIHQRMLEQAERFVQADGKDDSALDGFCATLEGVSHFLYLTVCGNQDRSVSQIELELQAELDKFVLTRLLFGFNDLIPALFDHFELDAELSPAETERYRVANRHARRYARWLDQKFERGHYEASLTDARALYRKSWPDKLGHIAAAA